MLRPLPDPRRRCIKLAQWPELDRSLWTARLAEPSSLDHICLTEKFRPASLEKVREGYGRWLGFLTFTGDLDPTEPPADRVTQPRANAFFQLMRELGNRDHTVLGRYDELTRALKILAPDRDFPWLLKPAGVLIRTHLPMTSKTLFVPTSKELYDWGFDVAEAGLKMKGDKRRQVAFRDGLMIAILACRAPRLKNLRLMRLGVNLVRSRVRWRLRFSQDEVKNHQPLEYDLPKSLTWLIDRYLEVERQELLKGADSQFVWINWSGKPLGEMGVQKRILWLSMKKFGVEFCPHRFRHAIGTSVPDADSDLEGVAASLLGISTQVLDRHYDRGGQSRAAKELQRNLEQERKDTAGRAAREFKEFEALDRRQPAA